MAELPILPLKTDALLADTSNMTAEEFGSYCRLLFVMWRHGGKLVNNAEELCRIAGVSLSRWLRISDPIMRLMTCGGGFISQKRLTDTWLNVQAVRHKRALAANRRWGDHDPKSSMQMDMHMQCKCNANQISKKERKKEESSEPHARAREGPQQAGIRGEPGGSEELRQILIRRGWTNGKP